MVGLFWGPTSGVDLTAGVRFSALSAIDLGRIGSAAENGGHAAMPSIVV
ncbi:hypothetical protein DSM3645_16670 [Blastopirellula marina DSM 3645]|uniref:Uncharacterized protein n=1 Tax=Blastopirellula marina DSM 3645 TaxID=314230 RepID=A3ZN64_9BACT|nr:hypothetical protein DSM3645_16670 [Blastopirellula marina DSM 3645]